MIMLSEQLAQNIVEKMMDVIPYNVNIMDSEGIIIGSGDKNRIGKLHEGAVKAIREDKLIAVYETIGGAKPGVNMPIYFNSSIMGVIGISGDPTVVEPFASIVKVTAELLINQEYNYNEKRVKERKREEFLYQWAYNENYDANFIHMAEVLNIDLKVKRTAVIINSKERGIRDKIRRYLYEDEYSIRINVENLLIFMREDFMLKKRILNLFSYLGSLCKIGIGTEQNIMFKSVQQALRAVEIIEKLQLYKSVCHYKDIAFIDAITNTVHKEVFYNLIDKLNEQSKGLDLVGTLIAYIMFNGEVNAVAKELHIHRNSLNYRLNKIQDITEKDPKNLVDLLELSAACILYKLR